MKKKIAVAGSLLAAMFALSAPASAGVVFLNGNVPQADEENVLFNGAGTISQGFTVTGRTNQSSTLVAFKSSEELITPASGQARIDASDGAFTDLNVSLLNGGTFGDLIFNLNTPNSQTGTARITVNTTDGSNPFYDLAVTNGQNFLTLYVTEGTRIASVDIDSTVGLEVINIDDANQFRISEIQGPTTPVPEPGTLALFAAGLIGIQRLRQKYSK